MRQSLKRHNASHGTAVSGIVVEITRVSPSALELHYLVTGKIGALSLPPPAEPQRTDNLWQHTCLEAFIRPVPGEAYDEFNFAPSSAWAAYAFSGYREGMETLPEARAPLIETHVSDETFELRASLDLAVLLGLRGPCHVGLAAVIEEHSGDTSYWALAHPPGPPDLHAPHCFALELAAQEDP